MSNNDANNTINNNINKSSKNSILLNTLLIICLIFILFFIIFNFINYVSGVYPELGHLTKDTDFMWEYSRNHFNFNFTKYSGAQTGSQIKSLINDLITNADTYKEEPIKIISLNSNYLSENRQNSLQVIGHVEPNNTTNYVLELENMEKLIENEHTYWVEIVYNIHGYVDTINIYYEKTDIDDESLNTDINGMKMPFNCLNRD